MKKSKREVVKPEVVETDVEADEVMLESWKMAPCFMANSP